MLQKFWVFFLDDKLCWDEHVNHCQKKIACGLYAINAAKICLRIQYLRSLYYTMVHPFLHYGCVLWGAASKKILNPLRISQKKAIRAVCKAKYNASTNQLFKAQHILKLDDIYSLEVSKFMYKITNKLVPQKLEDYFITNINIHKYNTRHSKDYHFHETKNNLAFKCLLYSGPRNWFHLQPNIKNSSTVNCFIKKVKKHIFDNYNP